jgi:type II secretory pathway component PulL
MVGSKAEWAANYIKTKVIENNHQDASSSKDTEIVSLLMKAGAAVPAENKTDPTMLEALNGIKEQLKEVLQGQTEQTIILRALPDQLQKGFRLMQARFSNVSLSNILH